MPQLRFSQRFRFRRLPVEVRLSNWIRRLDSSIAGKFKKPYKCRIPAKLGLALGFEKDDTVVKLNEFGVLVHDSTGRILGSINGDPVRQF